MPTDLSLITTEDLIEELKSRFDVFVGYGAREHPYEDESTVYTSILKGPFYAVIGIWELLKARELHDFAMESRDIEDGEDT